MPPIPEPDPSIVPQLVFEFFKTEWPPGDARELYDLGWQKFPSLGKEVCVRAALAAYEVSGDREKETPFDRLAHRAVESWVVNPCEETRKHAGRIAITPLPQYSFARTLANMAGRRNGWRSTVAFALVGNPHLVPQEKFEAIRDAIERELCAWASGKSDPIGERIGNLEE